MNSISRLAMLLILSTLVACGGGAETAISEPPQGPVTLSVSNSGPSSEDPSGAVTTFRITASRTSTSSIDIVYETLDGSAEAGIDYTQSTGSVTLPAGLTTVEIDIAVLDDSLDEPDEDFTLRLVSVSSGVIGTSSAVATIVDDDPPVSLSIGDTSIVEGDSGQAAVDFLVGLSSASGFDVSVDYTTVDATAIAGSDFEAQAGTLTIPAGSNSATLSVQVFGDTLDESNETFGLQISNPAHASLSTASATATIIDNDNPNVPPDLSISVANAAAVSEGSGGAAMQFPITLSETAGVAIEIQYESLNQTATAGQDYVAVAGTATVAAGNIATSVSVPLTDDSLYEADESLQLRITDVSAGRIANATASGLILNNDSAPTLSVSDASLTEGDAGQQALVFTLTQSAVSGLDSQVSYTTVDGTATSGEDYQSVSGTATIAAGATQTTIQVDVSGDTLNEPDETLQLVLSGAQNASIVDGTSVGTIVNNDSLPSVTIADASTAEGNAGQTSLVFTISLSAISGSDVTVDYATSDLTAVAGEDYTATSGTATISTGATSTTVTVPVAGDSLFEADETLSVALSNATNASITVGTATGTLTNDDSAPGLSISDESIAEGDAGQSNVTFTVSLDAVSGVEATVNYGTADGTATAGEDYLAASGQLTIAAGDLQGSISVPVIGDTIDEPDETFAVSLSSASNSSITDGSGVGTIVDDEAMPAVSIADTSVNEGNSGSASLVFTLTLSAVSGSDVTVDYATSDGTAIAGDDYTATSGTATITAGTTSTTVSVPVTGDVLFETDESIQISLSLPSNAVIADGTATGVVTNDDSAPGLSISDESIAEGDSGQSSLSFTVTLDAVSGVDATVSYGTTDGSATAGDDYIAGSGLLTIPAGDLQGSIAIPVIGDTIDEPDEIFTVALSGASNSSITDGTGVGTIIDDDAMPVVSVANTSIAEGNSGTASMVFTLTLSALSGSDVTVSYATSDGTAVAGEDYTATSGTATIIAGTTSTTVTVPVAGDTLFEADETLSFTVSNATNASIADGSATGTLTNDDTAPGLSISDESIAEGDSGQSSLTFTVSLDAVSGVDATVNYGTADGTATAGEDYLAASGQLTIAAGDLQGSISVQVIGDTIDEPDEAFTVSLSGASNSNITDGIAVGTITDDDSVPSISVADSSVAEGNSGSASLVFTLSLSAVSGSDVTVAYVTSDGTAIAGDDYTATSGTATIPAGSTSTTVTAPVRVDTLFEADEILTLSLSNPVNGSIADGTATGTLTNDDSAPGLSISDESIAEGDSGQANISFIVSLDAVSGLDATVNYSTADVTAVAGDDYLAASGQLTIAAGDLQGSILVPVIGDTIDEPNETFTVSLSGPSNSSITDGTGVGTIVDDEALPAVSIADTSVTEGNSGAASLVFTLSLSAVSGSDITVDYTTTDGSAVAGEDYTATSGTATITAGTTSTTVTVSVTGDVLFETDESLQISLSSPSAAVIADGAASGLILNDDSAPTLSVSDASLTEGDSGQQALEFTLTQSAISGLDSQVSYTTVDGTATSGEDYQPVSGTATIAAGATQTTIQVDVSGDTLNEPDETLQLVLSGAQNASILDGTGIGTIVNNDSLPSITIADASTAEGNVGQTNLVFTVSLAALSGSDVTVDYATSDVTAVAGEDYTATSGTATITAGTTNTTVTVSVNGDAVFEADETLMVTLSNATNASITDGTATGTLTNDDSAPGLSISDESIAEGDSGQSNVIFTVSLDAVSGVDATVNFGTANGTATAGEDYVATSGQLTIAAGDLQGSISVPVIGGTSDEPDETFTVSLSGASNSNITDGIAVGTITDDDSVPSISVADSSVSEGNSGASSLVFTLSLSAVSGNDVTVDYVTSNGTAIAGDDYTATSGTATIIAGTTSTAVTVPVTGDVLFEPDETLAITLSSPTFASLGSASAIGTISNDDASPQLSIADTSVTEGDVGQTSLSFTLSLSSVSGVDVSVDFVTADGSAIAANDYSASSGTAVITAGTTSSSVTVDVFGDAVFESDETLNVTLSSAVNASLVDDVATGTILNDDTAPVMSIADTSVIEPDSGQTDAVFVVSLDTASGLDASVSYTTASGTATAANDFVTSNGIATILAGELQATIQIPVLGDLIDEPNEAFSVTLSNPVSASLGDPSATGTIEDNDPEPQISVADASIPEGDTGQSTMSFVISIDAMSGKDVTVDFATSDASALSGEDYVATSGSATIFAGAISTGVSVAINGDVDEEGDESFLLGLTNPVNATIFDMSASGTIVDDDTSTQSGLTSRPSNSSCVAPARPTSNASIDNEIAFPNLPSLVKPVALIQAPGDTATWYVVEQDGRILSFDNNASTASTSTFLDIRSGSPIDVDSSTQEAGLFGIAFDPEYGSTNWDAYLSYTVAGSPLTSVIARIQSTDNGLTLDPSTAEILLTLDQPFPNHNGGHLLFGPDGFLYLTFGDGGSADDPNDRAQNTRSLFGAMIRIDVSGNASYDIPIDNPFFGNALCDDGNGSSSCPEIFAWGFRNPWRWSFDTVSGQLWLGDVGQNSWEEVNQVELGGNYGWRCREGSNSNITTGFCPPGLIDPVIEYSNVTVGDSVTGGEVYRGSAIPELAGRYVFADYVRGKIFASVDNGDGTYGYETLLETSQFISSFSKEANGELLYLDYGSGLIRRIIQAGGSSNNTIPDLLSNSGCVSVSDVTQPADGLIPYNINVPFWSDGAVKDRYYAIPDGTTIDVAGDGDWLFPNGTVLVKNFRLNGNLIETRLFMRHTDGEWGGYTYEWDAGETEATRVIGGKTKSIDGQDWIYPSESQCIQCHTAAANYSLGLEHGQLNKDLTYPSSGLTGNQLTTADFVDLLTGPLADSVQNLPAYPDPTNVAESLEDRARAYLHTNCAGCHRPAGPTPSNMDLRYATPLNSTGTCNVTPNSATLGIPNARLIMPGDAASSLVVERASRRDIHGMPPLGSTIVDADGVQLLTDWINSLSSCP